MVPARGQRFVRSQGNWVEGVETGTGKVSGASGHILLPYPQGHPGKEGPPGTKGNQVRASRPSLVF